ncbi:MAG: YbaK/EbsC family protein [Candidatus Kerfeldbacteria bacterium]|nr:YbaK/EbsC family protein [Candidatus Kerfeldbacteria bacterium]
MPIPAKVTKHLDANKVKYDVVPHKTVFTVYDLAQTLKIKMNGIIKTLLVKADKEYVLTVLPAHVRLDLVALKKTLKAKVVRLAKEKEMQLQFKVKPGAMTPFGSLHKVAVVMDTSLAKAEKVLLGAGTFTESLRMKMKDYVKLEKPTVAKISSKK